MQNQDKKDYIPLGRQFTFLAKRYFGVLGKKLEHLEIDRYFYVLLIIHEQHESCTQQQIADHLHIDKASMARIVDHLVRKELVQRTVNPSNRRAHMLGVTKKGAGLIPEIRKAIRELNESAVAGMPPRMLEHFYEALSTICKNLGQQPAHLFQVNFKKIKSKA